MSKGGGMPDPAAWAGCAQTRDPLEISRQAVSEWLRRVEGARDAMMRSGLPVGKEAAELNLACEDLRASWARFDGFLNLLLTRIGDDPLEKLPLAGMIAMFMEGIGAAAVASKYFSLPTMGDLHALTKSEMADLRNRKKHKPKGKAATAARAIAYDLASPLWAQDGKDGAGFRFRGKHTAVAAHIYVDFCRGIRDVVPRGSHWLPPQGGRGTPFEKYRTKMLNAIRDAYAKWEKAQPPGAV